MGRNEIFESDPALKALDIALNCGEQVNELMRVMTGHMRRLAVSEILITVLLSETNDLSSAIKKIETIMESGSYDLLSSQIPVEEISSFRPLFQNKLDFLRTLQNKSP
ncbi:hypothetical protein [Methyloglobulus sp.]|uniref:hypothetical protein n=1 Tax=Methyloglobulus sp. TaxID=2518622 RepID=UPI0032B80E4B